ncbi:MULTISPECIES: pyridoxal phosphate-dependent aminotransferase [unclassified Thiomonas]|jgi:methionine aminotransferase|uniref:pyridoxal phosphate-dependent aminotransferase n=1 Tax=unclassified Thiomonas TaxID=2625466 RepID=UPI0004DBC235|nr:MULTISPECIES: pyridoxal phosphate-dependent aminotransferase [unclassified Thiomonas]MDD4999873.1 pyridoxal phosphate-dependent aminotransferase [Thiomonas arsenitoxydans]MDE2174406.1 pyridoxal phosphate-dependent aminotransferase [Betaproteobacteria bacterium]CDW94187.1 methionine aminotransferase, PLP-dependent [Thiomonas sp. CB2]VDY04478.1 methionine aminotransferase, PLP-dependent [Thiomonas sp. Bio17B3]VDY08351.1 methionine aminotransferase, PLP-dependent [Thiomonas sp. Sup16B3]
MSLQTHQTPHIASRLPQVGTTIFTVMSALAQEHGAINLGQGFPDFSCDPRLIDAVDQAMRRGANQYPPMTGVPALRQAVADKIAALHGMRYDADAEITITAGATQAIFTALLAVVHPGDEVIVLTPSYDSYLPNIALCGGVARTVPLQADFRPDFAAIAAAITPRTRALLINSPHNPSGTVWSEADMRQLEALLAPTDIVLIADEVYEHMVFDGAQHQSAARFPGLAARTFVVSSFGKTFHVTGWKVGSVAAPAALTAEFRKVHQFNVFTVNTPMQHGLAHYLADPAPYRDLPGFYQAKRDRFRAGLAGSRFELLPCSGSYFQCVRYDAISDLPDDAFCRWLTAEIGVAAIPLSAFEPDGRQRGVVRFCFAKQDATLDAALKRLAAL